MKYLKIITFLFIFSLIVSFAIYILMGGESSDSKQIKFDVQPVIQQGRTLVPLRAIFESLGVIL